MDDLRLKRGAMTMGGGIMITGGVSYIKMGVIPLCREVIDGLLEKGRVVIGNPVMKMVGVIQRLPEVEDTSGTGSTARDIARDVGVVHNNILREDVQGGKDANGGSDPRPRAPSPW